MKDDFGDRMKTLEKEYTKRAIPANEYIAVRIDGKGFSKFTKDLDKPFDQNFTRALQEVTKKLLEITPAYIGYVQSDEISLFFNKTDMGEHWFGGKVSKINSVLASMATWHFAKEFVTEKPAYFDCRTWGVPDAGELSNTLLWRIQDCKRNSISSCYRWIAHKKKMPSQAEMIEYLEKECDYKWEDLEEHLMYGSLYRKFSVTRVNDDGGTYIRNVLYPCSPFTFYQGGFNLRASYVQKSSYIQKGR